MLEDHASDDQSLACNGEALLVWPASKKVKKGNSNKAKYISTYDKYFN